jgi:hypothetical protein
LNDGNAEFRHGLSSRMYRFSITKAIFFAARFCEYERFGETKAVGGIKGSKL